MNWDTFACAGPFCNGAVWIVERVEEAAELWRITSGPTDPGFLVAAAEPICPRCGETLQAVLELEGVTDCARHSA